jgi:hypothetical protein
LSAEQRVHHVTPTTSLKGRAMNQIDTILTLIAKKHLGIETLETRRSDSLDFHDTAVWCLKDALEAAFKAGVELGVSMPKATEAEIAKN